MQILFDFSTLYQTNPLFSSSSYTKHIDLSKLKTWWRDLSAQQQTQICQIDSNDVLSDLSEASNDAFLVCKLSSEYREKALVACTRSIDKKSGIQVQEYRFNFVGKDVISSNLSSLFSSYYLYVSKDIKKGETSILKIDSEENDTQKHRSLLNVKEESLCSLIDTLESTVINFMKDSRPSFDQSAYNESYSALEGYSFQKFPTFRHVESSAIQKLLHKFVAITILLENNIYQSYQRKVESTLPKTILTITPEAADSDISSQDTKNISPPIHHSGSKSLPLTPSQRIQNQKDSKLTDNKTTPPISTTNQHSEGSLHQIFSSLNKISHTGSSNNSEETTNTEQNAVQQNKSENLAFSPFDFSLNPGLFFFGKIQNNWEDTAPKNKELQINEDKDQPDEYFADQFATYEGFEVGDLRVAFDPVDPFLIRLGDRDRGIDYLKQEILIEQMEQEELMMRRYNSLSLYSRRYASNETRVNNLNLQRNFTDPIEGSVESQEKTDSYGGYYGGSNSSNLSSPRRGNRYDEGYSRRGDEAASAQIEWRDPQKDQWSNYNSVREQYGNDSYNNDYRYRSNYKRGNPMKIYYCPKEKTNGDGYVKTPRQQQDNKETAVES